MISGTPVRGYNELESSRLYSYPHSDGILLNSGRNALKFTLHGFEDVGGVFGPCFHQFSDGTNSYI